MFSITGFTDIAIGAPYGGKDGRGVVYVYHGSMMGIITDVQQVTISGSKMIVLKHTTGGKKERLK